MATRKKKPAKAEEFEMPADKWLEPVDLATINEKQAMIDLTAARVQIIKMSRAIVELQTKLQIVELKDKEMAQENELRSRKARLEGLVNEFSEKYGVDFTSCTYDDKTGKITEL